MSKREEDINWSKLANASLKLNRLHLEDDCDGLFHCPVRACNHDGFNSQRGCRKHVKNKHRWYFHLTKSQTPLRLKKRVKATRMKATIPRLSVRSGQLHPLTCQATLLEIFHPGSPAVAEAVKRTPSTTNCQQVFEVSKILLRRRRGAHSRHSQL